MAFQPYRSQRLAVEKILDSSFKLKNTTRKRPSLLSDIIAPPTNSATINPKPAVLSDAPMQALPQTMAGSLDEEDEDDDKNIESDTERASIVAPQDSSVDDVESISDRDLTTPTTPAAATHFSDAAQIPQDSGKHGDDSHTDIDDSQPTSEVKLPQTSLPYEKSSFIKSQPNDDFSDEGDLFNFDALIPPEIWEDFLPVG